MNNMDVLQILNTIFTGFTVIVAIIAVILAFKIGQKQNEINNRLLSLQDYVAISFIPDSRNGVIKLLNTGKSNLYLWGFDWSFNSANNNYHYEKARLISAGTNDSSYYWIPLPKNIDKISTTTNFDIKLYLEDDYGNKWVSEGGGEANPIKIMSDEKEVPAAAITIWSYKTYKDKWSF
ncbi:MAG: hypothetical protein JWO40_679 [Candidatus Doudnabacteria bacterium]|nr:hypothetical protein [Candidatus Doudnabacteria bacterium]